MSTKTLNDKDLQDYYDQIFAMYGTRGWARLQEQVKEMIAVHNSLADVNTTEQLHFRKGQLDQMLWLENHQAAHEAAYNSLLAEQEGGVEQVASGGKAEVLQ